MEGGRGTGRGGGFAVPCCRVKTITCPRVQPTGFGKVSITSCGTRDTQQGVVLNVGKILVRLCVLAKNKEIPLCRALDYVFMCENINILEYVWDDRKTRTKLVPINS